MPDTPPSTRTASANRRVNTRLTVLLFIFVFWMALVVIRLGQLMIFEHDRTLADLNRASTFTGVVPALRGRLLDRDGRVLAWSERRFRVTWTVPADPETAAEQSQAFQPLPRGDAPRIPEAESASAGQALNVAENLNVEQAARWRALIREMRTLQISGYSRRQYVPDLELRRVLGAVRYADEGVAIGIKGAEQLHDRVLRGQPGVFQVMIDKHGDWIPETWRSIRDARAGFDVHLPIRTDGGEHG